MKTEVFDTFGKAINYIFGLSESACIKIVSEESEEIEEAINFRYGIGNLLSSVPKGVIISLESI